MIDAHCHLDPELPVDGLLRAMDASGVQRAALIPAANEAVGSIPKLGPPIFHACMRIPALRARTYRTARTRMTPIALPDNDGVFEAARAHPDRFLPFAFVNPTQPEAHDVLDDLVARGARGLKLHAWLHDFRLPHATDLIGRATNAGLPVLAHLGEGDPDDVRAVLDAVPAATLILAHAGIPHFERVWDLPVWFDVAARELVSDAMVRRLVRSVDPARVIFGSDAPVGLRTPTGYRYPERPIPDRALQQNFEALL